MRKTVGVLVVLFFLAGGSLPVSAKQTEWRDPAYNFSRIKTVVVMEANFSYDGFDVSGNNRFEKYPYPEEKVRAMVKSRLQGITNVRYLTFQEVAERVKSDPAFAGYDPASREFWTMVTKELPKYADAVLVVNIRDFGWFYEYREAYHSTETRTERVAYGGVTPDGKPFTGWMDVPRTVVVYHPPRHEIYDSAEANFELLDAPSGKAVWKFNDTRIRSSFSFSKAYDHTGPESIMNRIMDEFLNKLPLMSKAE